MRRSTNGFDHSNLTHRLLIVLAWLAVTCSSPSAAADFEEGLIQLHLAEGASIEAIHGRYGTSTVDALEPLYLLQIPEGTTEQALISEMSLDPACVCVEHSFRDETPEGTRQMVVTAVGGTIDDYLDQSLIERLHLAEIHSVSTGEDVLVAVLDTGVFAGHEALEDVIAPGGYDFVDMDADPTDEANGVDDDGDRHIDEGAGHGTLVAGIIHLVAPQARILPIRVLDDEGRGTTFDLAKGIRYAVEQGADVINMSLGLTSRSGIIAHELAQARQAERAMIAPAGNLGADSLLCFPAVDSRVLMVTALDSSDVKADFANYHPLVSISAPGVGILGPYYDGGYAIGAGTSFAAPFISGQCALIHALAPEHTWSDLYESACEGVTGIYGIPENEPFVDRLGSGRFDGGQTLLAMGMSAGVDRAADESWLRVRGTVLSPGGQTRVTWAPVGHTVRLRAFDIGGRLVRSETAVPEAGALTWVARDDRGQPLPAGVYLLELGPGGRLGYARVVVVR